MPAVHQKQEKNHSRERQQFYDFLEAIGNDYRASLAMFLSSPLSDQQIAKERRRAEEAGLGFDGAECSYPGERRGRGTTCVDHPHGRTLV